MEPIEKEIGTKLPGEDSEKDEKILYQNKENLSEVHVTLSEEEKSLYEDTGISSKDEKASPEEKDTLFKDEDMVSKEEKTSCEDEETLSDDEKTLSGGEKSLSDDEKTLSGGEKSLSGDENSSSKKMESFSKTQKNPFEAKNLSKDEKLSSTTGQPVIRTYCDRYTVTRVLKEGQFGEVVLVIDRRASSKQNNDVLVLKKIPAEDDGRSCKEAVLMKMIQKKRRHFNIVQIVADIFDKNLNAHIILTEYCAKGDLHDLIVKEEFIYPTSRARRFFVQLLNGVEFLHELGIAHRDIKPANIFVTKGDNTKLGDFGFATVFRTSSGSRRLTTICGTVENQAPQCVAGNYTYLY